MKDNNIRTKIGAGFVGGAIVLGVVGYELGDELGAFLGIAGAGISTAVVEINRRKRKNQNLLTRFEEGIRERGLEGLFNPGHYEMMKNLRSTLKREDYLGLVAAGREADPLLSRYTLETRYGKVNLYTDMMGLTVESFTNFKDCPDREIVETNIAYKLGLFFRSSVTVPDAQVFRSERIVVELFDKYFLYDNWEYQLAARALKVTAAESMLKNYLQGGNFPSSEEIRRLNELPRELKLYL